jgi:protein O-mannosyl-transferase
MKRLNTSPARQKLIVYLALTIVTFAVFWQVNHYGFIILDDDLYVVKNIHVQSGITPEGFLWALSSKDTGLWNPLVWLSLMFDYQLYGLNAGGYHLTNLILHIMSALLLFRLFHSMTGAIWRSAFVAAVFALHPLHVESVAWIAERKDVLSALFWMLTLCLYVYYTEKPVIKRYLPVLFSFVLALMSKPMVVTLPLIFILLDYWPLKRFASKKDNLWEWQLKEKTPFFILSAAIIIVTLYNPAAPGITDNQGLNNFPLVSRLANAPVSFAAYLGKTLWPHDLAVFYPFSERLPQAQVWGASLLIILISAAVIITAKRLPYLFAGWMWYAITIVPVIGIIQVSTLAPYAMADRYHYLPSIGLGVMTAWGIPALLKSDAIRKNLLFPAGIIFLALLSLLSWNQCGYWRDSIILFSHALKVTDNNWLAYNNRGYAYEAQGFNNQAIEDFDRVVAIKPLFPDGYYNRGHVYQNLRNYRQAIEDYNRAIEIKPDHAGAYNNRGVVNLNRGDNISGCQDAQKACALGSCKLLEAAKARGDCI